MRAQTIRRTVGRCLSAVNSPIIPLAVVVVVAVVSRSPAFAEAEASTTLPLKTESTDPFGPIEAESDPFETVLSDTPIDSTAYVPPRTRWDARRTNFEAPIRTELQQPESELPQPKNFASAPSAK